MWYLNLSHKDNLDITGVFLYGEARKCMFEEQIFKKIMNFLFYMQEEVKWSH